MKSKGKLNSPFGKYSGAYYLWLALVTVLIFPTMFLIVYLSSVFIPAHSAETHIEAIDTRVSLTFYFTSTDNDSGRYLTAQRPADKIKLKMDGFDWAHNARTNLYLTPDRTIAVVALNDDYLLSSTFTKLGARDAIESDKWTYLGAFEFVKIDSKKSLQFITPDRLVECIPMLSRGPFQDSLARASARRSSCPEYRLPESKSDRDPIPQSR